MDCFSYTGWPLVSQFVAVFHRAGWKKCRPKLLFWHGHPNCGGPVGLIDAAMLVQPDFFLCNAWTWKRDLFSVSWWRCEKIMENYFLFYWCPDICGCRSKMTQGLTDWKKLSWVYGWCMPVLRWVILVGISSWREHFQDPSSFNGGNRSGFPYISPPTHPTGDRWALWPLARFRVPRLETQLGRFLSGRGRCRDFMRFRSLAVQNNEKQWANKSLKIRMRRGLVGHGWNRDIYIYIYTHWFPKRWGQWGWTILPYIVLKTPRQWQERWQWQEHLQ